MSPNSTCDLHLHTHYSDGRASPAEVLHHAAAIGLRTVSITDHDNVNGAREAAFVAKELGLELIPGIEVTSRWNECDFAPGGDPLALDIDVLGYYIDPEDPGFLSFTHAAIEDLRARIKECCSLITRSGFPVSLFDIADENPRYPGAVPLIQSLWHKGYASSWNEAFPMFVRHWREVRLCRFTIAQVIEAIHSAGGAAVLAHPVQVSCGEGWMNADQVQRLKGFGLDGLEVYHPRLSPEARAHFLELAKRFNLAICGGSDEHGWRGGFLRMGSEPIPYYLVNELRNRCRHQES